MCERGQSPYRETGIIHHRCFPTTQTSLCRCINVNWKMTWYPMKTRTLFLQFNKLGFPSFPQKNPPSNLTFSVWNSTINSICIPGIPGSEGALKLWHILQNDLQHSHRCFRHTPVSIDVYRGFINVLHIYYKCCTFTSRMLCAKRGNLDKSIIFTHDMDFLAHSWQTAVMNNLLSSMTPIFLPTDTSQ